MLYSEQSQDQISGDSNADFEHLNVRSPKSEENKNRHSTNFQDGNIELSDNVNIEENNKRVYIII